MTIQLPLPLRASARASTDTASPIERLKGYLHAQGRSLLACLEFVADEPGIAVGYRLIEEARRATAWTRRIDQRVARVRALLTLEHLDSDEAAMPARDLFDDIDWEAVHACCLHADFLCDLRATAAADGWSQIEIRPAPPRPAMRPALPQRGAPARRSVEGVASTAGQTVAPLSNQRTI